MQSRWLLYIALLTALSVSLAACKMRRGAREPEDDAGPSAMDASTSQDAQAGDATTPLMDARMRDDATVSGDAGQMDALVQDASSEPWPLPTSVVMSQHCKLISDLNLDDPTPNDTHTRANLRGTDLGISVAHDDDLYVFFGDTAGYRAIWPLGPESLPDAVGYSAVPLSAVADDAATLCENLRFLALAPEDSAGPSYGLERDFAGGYMNAPDGESIADYIHNPAGPRGDNAFPNLPGDFEVPSGGFSYDGSIYIFYSIVQPNPIEMKGSYLARWPAPSTSGLPVYDILHHVDQRFDANGPLRGDFINIAPVVVGDYVYLFGTGKYRESPVHLARKLLINLATEGGFERYDAATETWIAANAQGSPIVSMPNIGELSVRYFLALQRFVMLDQEQTRLAARFAEKPEGPWSEPLFVAKMDEAPFNDKYCCIGNDCVGERMLHCDRAGVYAPFMLPDVVTNPDGSFAIDFLLSTWDPYNVALMRATFSP